MTTEKLPNCPACGATSTAPDEYIPSLVNCACGPPCSLAQWRQLAEFAAKARAWDAYVMEDEGIAAGYVLAEERRRGGLS